MVIGASVFFKRRFAHLLNKVHHANRISTAAKCSANKSIQNICLDWMRHRILFMISRHIDDDGRNYEWDAQQIQRVTVKCYYRERERVDILLIWNNCAFTQELGDWVANWEVFIYLLRVVKKQERVLIARNKPAILLSLDMQPHSATAFHRLAVVGKKPLVS